MRLTDLDRAVASSGLPYETTSGWQTRGKEMRAARSVMAHHTGTPNSRKGNYPTHELIISGRPGVPGPLAHLGLGRDGKVYIIAAGRANHAGKVGDAVYANESSIGIEAEHPGGGTPWPPAQYQAYVRLVAALCKWYRIPVDRVVGHKEAAVPRGRKPDPNFSMNTFRADVRAAYNNPAAVSPQAATPPTKTGDPVIDGDLRQLTVAALEKALGVPVTGQIGWTSKWTPGFAPATTVALQELLIGRAYPGGTIAPDHVFSKDEIKALQGTLNHVRPGIIDPKMIDGLWGEATTCALQTLLQGVPEGGLRYVLDNKPFPNTLKGQAAK